ncbi:12767_t:CDS:2, partial [Funneliformis geosporum]
MGEVHSAGEPRQRGYPTHLALNNSHRSHQALNTWLSHMGCRISWVARDN